ncbi:hypothetical protein bcgnr5378_05130 [Bacillus cereus]|uniref:RNase H type-1 domain-containing protein n=1 Tax=Bacillus cereus TaxID=1396 RepID=A0A164LDQ2_BACCE|nr:reverse transcriptase-like protein [Bacillus cereus]KZD55705.1 hypothetical protein B4088_5450 [Bacillus cereus]
MKTYIVDGSCKKYVLGAGVVEIDSQDFVEVHSFRIMHLGATSFLAEVYALECAVNLIRESNIHDKKIVIYTDNKEVYNLFKGGAKKGISNYNYICTIEKQLKLLSKLANLQIKLVDKKMEKMGAIAHELSRVYFDDPLIGKLLNKTSIDLPLV